MVVSGMVLVGKWDRFALCTVRACDVGVDECCNCVYV